MVYSKPSLFCLLLIENIVTQDIYDKFRNNRTELLSSEVLCTEPFDIINTRIINGHRTQGNWPFMVRLELYPNRKRTEFFQCGGSVINENWILTAAHCLDDIETADIVIGSKNQQGTGPRLRVVTV